MRVLVTGGSGFIGQHVCDVLRDTGHTQLVFDRKADRADILGTITDPVSVTEAVAAVDGVIHLAACLGTQETIQNPWPAIETNIKGTVNVFEACVQYDVPCVYIAVGNHGEANSYSITKTCAEHFARMFNLYRGARINVVRAVNAYGPGQRAAAPFGESKVRKIMPAFVCRALSGMPIEVYGDGQQVSDMIYVTDLAAILVEALLDLEANDPIKHVLEVGPDSHYTVDGVARIVNEAAGGEGIIHLPMRPGETRGSNVTADTTTLAPLKYHPADFLPLEDGVARTVRWFRDQEGKTWRRPSTSSPSNTTKLFTHNDFFVPSEALRSPTGSSSSTTAADTASSNPSEGPFHAMMSSLLLPLTPVTARESMLDWLMRPRLL